MVRHYTKRIGAVVYKWSGFNSRWTKNNTVL